MEDKKKGSYCTVRKKRKKKDNVPHQSTVTATVLAQYQITVAALPVLYIREI